MEICFNSASQLLNKPAFFFDKVWLRSFHIFTLFLLLKKILHVCPTLLRAYLLHVATEFLLEYIYKKNWTLNEQFYISYNSKHVQCLVCLYNIIVGWIIFRRYILDSVLWIQKGIDTKKKNNFQQNIRFETPNKLLSIKQQTSENRVANKPNI